MGKAQHKYMISQISPRLLENLFNSLRKGKTYSKENITKKLKSKDLLYTRDHVLLSELIDILINFKVLYPINNGSAFELSEIGQKLKSIFLRNRALFFEIYHLLNYYAFDMNDCSLSYLPFRSYQLVCDAIYKTRKYPKAKVLADRVDHVIKTTYQVQGSFSEVCVTRGIAWLKKLSPPVFDEYNEFIVRRPDNTEVVLYNLSCYYKIKAIKYGDPLFLDRNSVNDISKAGFIDAIALEDILKELSNQFPMFIKIKYNISGSIVVLSNEVSISRVF